MDLFIKIDRFLSRYLPPAVKRIFLINCAVFLTYQVVAIVNFDFAGRLIFLFAEDPAFSLRRLFIWQFLTYMFVHVQGFHILFNMLILWFFAPELEMRWGNRRFWTFYLVTGIGAGVCHSALALISNREMMPIIGASGALFGVLLAFGAYYPHRRVLFWGVFPMDMWILVSIIIFFEFLTLRGTVSDGISHITHLSGLAVAYIYLARYHHTSDLTRWRYLR